MIIPMKCFTCGLDIAHLWDQYVILVKNYEIARKPEDPEEPTFKALRDLKIGRECCRRMFICQHDMYEQIH